MCKVLADLLGIEDPLFSVGVHQLELAGGQPNIDVKLYAEVIKKSHQKMRELGLDPKDTTAPELYQALIGLIKKHDDFLARRLGAKDSADVAEVLKMMQVFVTKLDVPKTAWVIKAASAKRLLKATPPKKVMKQLGYRSLDSMLKREHMPELFAIMRIVETPEWFTAFTKKYSRLNPNDFETRKVEFVLLDTKRLGAAGDTYVRQSHHNVTHVKEMGVVALLPLPVAKLPGIAITVLPLLLHYLNEIRMYSSYFKLQQVSPDFGDIIVTTLVHDPSNHVKVAGHDVHWRTVQKHFGKQAVAHPESFEPHVQAEDLYWRKAEEVLFRVEPALHFWHDIDYVGASISGQVVSLNLMDVAVNYVNKLAFGQRTVTHFRASLWNEIFARYIGQPALEYQVVKQLTHETPESEFNENMLEEMFL